MRLGLRMLFFQNDYSGFVEITGITSTSVSCKIVMSANDNTLNGTFSANTLTL